MEGTNTMQWHTRVDWIWLALVSGSLLTAWLGEHGAAPAHVAEDPAYGVHLGRVGIAAVPVLSSIKGLLIALSYMELQHAPALWRRLVLGWLFGVIGVIAAVSLWP